MKNYNIVLSEQAESDLQEYIDYIIHKCKAPITALRHYENLFATLNSLKHFPESFSIQTHTKFILQFGFETRRINFKKMAIIYTVHNDLVIIQRIIPASLITGL